MLRAKDITVRYGARTVLDGVSFSLEKGQWLMLCGPNGAGKSTLVKAVSRDISYAGAVYLNGQDTAKIKSSQFARTVGVLPQHNSVSYAFTVEEVVRMGRYANRHGLFSAPDAEDTAAVEEALLATGLGDMRAQSVLTLSGGELQRVFLAQVFAQRPQILLLDEPTNHLDLKYQQQMFSLIGAWLRQEGHAVLSVVHDLTLARRYGTHALLLSEGKTVALGKMDAVLSPEHLCAAYQMDVYAWMQGLFVHWAKQ